ncbi:hypothetical protein [Desulfosediminicola sp.]|uniref:hypothetical protein n=1 Tax=Desulfosediminicola sp. TaxID=2886825 RepID=UPI003AF27549
MIKEWSERRVLVAIYMLLPIITVMALERVVFANDNDENSTPVFLPEVSIGLGYRNDQLSFTIAGFEGTPNVLSELEWDSVESMVLTGDVRWCTETHIYFRAHALIGTIYSGDSRDSDYEGDNRTMEYSRSYADTDDGSVFDGSFGLGYSFDVALQEPGTYWRFIPVIGYAFHTQEFEMTNGYQELYIDEDGISWPPGPFDGLDSSYDSDWSGPWIGIELEWRPAVKHSLIVGFEYSWLDYEADATWNLREDLMQPTSFEHDADGSGVSLNTEYRYDVTRNWYLGLQFYYYNMSTDSGTKTTYAADGTIYKSKFNGADWESYSALVKMGYYF